jgi:hypothetical protein
MSAELLIIECIRCGETRMELLSASETQALSDAVSSLSRYCAQCGSTTGWVRGRGRLKAELLNQSTHKDGVRTAARPIPAGQERLASQSELNAITELLQQRKAMRPGGADERSWPSTHQESSMEHSNNYLHLAPPLISNRAVTNGEEGESTFSPDKSSQEAHSPVGNGGSINRFLLCTIVWSVAREVKARGEANGERLPMAGIAREVLRSYLCEGERSGQYLLDEEALEDEIKRRLHELSKQSRMQHAEERRLDIESLVAAEQTKRGR